MTNLVSTYIDLVSFGWAIGHCAEQYTWQSCALLTNSPHVWW